MDIAELDQLDDQGAQLGEDGGAQLGEDGGAQLGEDGGAQLGEDGGAQLGEDGGAQLGEDQGGEDQGGEDQGGEDQGADEFPREYVEKLRKENKRYREAAAGADELAQRLHTALVQLDGRLADADALAFNADHLADADALAGAISDVIARNPRLSARSVHGDVGAGSRGTSSSVDLITALRGL